MNPPPTLTTFEPRVGEPTKPKWGRLFYTGASVLILVLMLLGFYQYYLRGKTSAGGDIPVPMRTPILLHVMEDAEDEVE